MAPGDLGKMETKKRVLGKNWGREVDIENDGEQNGSSITYPTARKSGMFNMAARQALP